MLPWIFLLIAGFCEVGFTTALFHAERASGWEAAGWYGVFGVALVVGMGFFVLASHHIEMGTAYAVFAGMGAVGTVLVGIVAFQEPTGFWRLFFLTTLIVSVIGLNVVSHR